MDPIKKKALERIRGLAGDAMGNRLKGLRQPPPQPEPEPEQSDELQDEDARRLIEMYEGRQEN